MSLDVYLISESPIKKEIGSGIFVRKNGATVEISRQEWDAICATSDVMNSNEYIAFNDEQEETCTVFDKNITHNLNKMAEAVGIYNHLWRPEEIGIEKAHQLINPLREGLHELKLNPEKYKELNPKNGWGSYDGLVNFVEEYLNACYKYPNAKVEVSR